jgi:Flp pilus assembly protein TadD
MCRNENRWLAAVSAVLALAAAQNVQAAEGKARRPLSPPAPLEASTVNSGVQLPQSVKAERELVRSPGNRDVQLEAARAHLAEGANIPSRVLVAYTHALAVLEDNPADVEALLLAGQTSLLKGDAASAVRYYRAATQADSGNASAFLGLGDALGRQGDEPGATAAFARYRELTGMPPLPAGDTAN